MTPVTTWRVGSIEYGLFRHPLEGTGRRWSIRLRTAPETWSVPLVFGHTRATALARLEGQKVPA